MDTPATSPERDEAQPYRYRLGEGMREGYEGTLVPLKIRFLLRRLSQGPGRAEAAAALGAFILDAAFAKTAIGPLIEAIEDPEMEVRMNAEETLFKARREEVDMTSGFDEALKSLSSPDTDTRIVASTLISDMAAKGHDTSGAFSGLLEGLSSYDRFERLSAAGAIGEMKLTAERLEEEKERILIGLSDPEIGVRIFMCNAIREAAADSDIGPFLPRAMELMLDPDEGVRWAVIDIVLAGITQDPVDVDMRALCAKMKKAIADSPETERDRLVEDLSGFLKRISQVVASGKGGIGMDGIVIEGRMEPPEAKCGMFRAAPGSKLRR